MTFMTTHKNYLLTSIITGFALTSCNKPSNRSPTIPSNFNGATAGVVNLTVTPYGGAGTSLLFAISGGTANIPITCSYFIFDYLSTTTPLVSQEYNYFTLDNTGSFSLEVPTAQCSLGIKTAAFITWQCYISATPFTVLTSINEGGSAFFFNCPI